MGPAVLLLLSIGFYWKLVLTNQYTWLDSPDLAHMVLPRFQFMASEWRHTRFPLWDPHQWNGQPFLGQWTGVAMPLQWPLLMLGSYQDGHINPGLLDWYFVLVHWLGAVFCYWLARDTGRSRSASVFAGCLFAFGGYLGATDWPEVFSGVIWVPLAFLFAIRAVRGGQPWANAALAGAVCGISWLSGHHQAPYYLTLAVCAVLAAQAIPRVQWTPVWLAGVAGAFSLAGGALQLLPGSEFGRLAVRWAGAPHPLTWDQRVPFPVHERYSLQPVHLPGIVLPFETGHTPLLVGAVGLAVVLAGLRYWNRTEVRIFAAVAVAGLVCAMAEYNGLYGLLYILPGFDKARAPARITMLFSFAVAPLAAFGLDALRERVPRRLPAVLLTLGVLLTAGSFGLRMAGKLDYVDRFSGIGFMMSLAAAVLVIGGRLLPPGLLAISLIELSQGRVFLPTSPNPNSFLQRLWDHRDVMTFLKGQPGWPFRVETSDGIKYNFGDWHLIHSTGGFTAGVTANAYGIEWPAKEIQDMMGVRFSVAKEPVRPGQEEVYAAPNGWKVYRNPNAFPRAWIVHEAQQRKAEYNVDFKRIATVSTAAPALQTCSQPEPVRWLEHQPRRLRLEATAACRGLLVVTDTWYPGWRATVDGQRAEILEVNGAFRGIVIGPGKHFVEMRFQPWTFYLGAAVTLLTLGAAVVIARRAGAARRSPPS